MYRAEALHVTEIKQLDTMGHNALENLQKVFPYGVWHKNGTFRSLFCTEKQHSMTHWADNYTTVGCIRIISTTVTETRMKTAVIRRQPPQEQHGDEDAAAPGRNWFEFAPFMSEQYLGLYHV